MSLKTITKNLVTIDNRLTLDGSVSFRGELIVAGTIKGRLQGDHVIIAETGRIEAETEAVSMTIRGVFKGSLRVNSKLSIRSGGSCSGTIACRSLEMETGSVLNGKIRCSPR